MKIVIATPLYPPEIGGPATYTKELVTHLRNTHECVVVAYTNNTQPIEESTLIPISKNQGLVVRLYKYFRALKQAGGDADVIYVQNAVAAGFPAVLVGILIKKPVVLKFVGDEAWERATQHKKTQKRLIEFLAEPEGGLRYRLMMKLQGWVLRHASVVTTPSAFLGDIIRDTYQVPRERIKVNYNAAEEITGAPFEATPKPHQVCTSARLVPWKGVDGILKAVHALVKKYPDIHLVIHGDGQERPSLEALATTLGIEGHVTFTGNVSRTETWHTRKESEVYVLNSTYEGLPHSALTSFAAKIPMVATDIPGTNEAVYDGVSGLLVPPDDSDALATAIDRLFTNEALRQTLIEGGQKILKEKFSWEAHLKTLRGIFESVSPKPSK